MEKQLRELLKLNKLIKVLIQKKDITGLNQALEQKDELIANIKEVDKNKYSEILKKIYKLDKENIRKLDNLMSKFKENSKKINSRKADLKIKNKKIRKYKSFPNSQGYKIDNKK